MTGLHHRRSILKSAGALSGVLLAPALPLWALADEVTVTAPQSEIDTYTQMSAALLGIEANVLVPELIQDNLPLSELYFSVATATPLGREMVDRLLVYYRMLVDQGASPAQVARILLSGGTGRPSLTMESTYARLTMMMWLYGIWYGGTEVTTLPTSEPYIDPAYRTDFIVSARAYKNAWIWRIAQSHPMGFSNFAFGSWAEKPPTLGDYGIAL
jgi:hypothetical protein